MKNIIAILIPFFGLFSFTVYSQTNNPYNQSPSEDDWTLPSYVQKNANAGLYWVDSVPDAYNVLLSWRQLNPSDDVYDFSLLDYAVSLNLPFFIRIWASDTTHCPSWLRVKHPAIPIMFNDGGINDSLYWDLLGPIGPNTISNSRFYAMWDSGFDTEFKEFLLALKAKNYFANPNVKFMYCPGGWRYNEWNLGGMVNKIVAQTNITPTNFVTWFKGHLDDYADATNGYPEKMMFTGYGRLEHPTFYGSNANWFFAANDTSNGSNLLTEYAVSIGMSVREGAQEYFNTSADQYNWGASSVAINNINYQTINDNHPLHNNILRNIGTENEGFCDPNMLQGGVCSYYHLKMSTLKAMQLRVNWLNTRNEYVDSLPQLYQYFRLTANKNVHMSPDAWAVLRQSYDPTWSSIPPSPILNSPLWVHRVTLPFRNWEKWLTQREVLPNGNVVPVYQLASNTTFDYFNFKALEALRTDRVNGSNYMYFDVDSNFIQGGVNDVQIKITYLDNFSGNWGIEYDAAGTQVYKPSTQITNLNDNKWKTITININDAGFTDRQAGGMDFRIYNGGTNDISVRFARVIKTANPITSTSNIAKISPISIYPNPSNSILNIESITPIAEVIITNTLGQIVYKNSSNTKNLNISHLTNGVYFISVKQKSDMKVYTLKFIKTD